METLLTKIIERNLKSETVYPNKKQAIKFIDDLFDTLYINMNTSSNTIDAYTNRFKILEKEFNDLIAIKKSNKAFSLSWEIFFNALPELYKLGIKDAEALFKSDPAANSLAEVLNTYPGFYAISIHRISNYLWLQSATELARLFSEYVHSKTGIDIHPGAQIGEGLAIDHGTGIVIGETSVIGKNVKLYQGVTLGAFSVSKDSFSKKRHPTIEDDVVIYSNATILGGGTTVGKGSIIGGNVWLTYSISSNSVVFHQIEIKVKDNNPFPEPINFVI
jgi:serine O-acetyltransferase